MSEKPKVQEIQIIYHATTRWPLSALSGPIRPDFHSKNPVRPDIPASLIQQVHFFFNAVTQPPAGKSEGPWGPQSKGKKERQMSSAQCAGWKCT